MVRLESRLVDITGVTSPFGSGESTPGRGSSLIPLLAQLGIGGDEVDESAVVRTLGPREAQAARFAGTDGAPGLRSLGHLTLLPDHGSPDGRRSAKRCRLVP